LQKQFYKEVSTLFYNSSQTEYLESIESPILRIFSTGPKEIKLNSFFIQKLDEMYNLEAKINKAA